MSAVYSPAPQIFLTVSHCTGRGGTAAKYCADTRAAYNSMRAQGIKNVHFLDVTQNGTGAWWSLGAAGGGCDSHPSAAAHALVGKIATPLVKEAMGWKTDDATRAGRRRTINFNIPTGPGGFAANLLRIKQAVYGSETSPIGPAAHILFNLVGTPDATLINQTRELLAAAVATRVPVFFGWDSQIFWSNRADLWNHWNSSAEGYNPKNKENVEWTSWDSNDAVDVSWLNWGSQMRVAPAQNIHAPAVKAATAHSLGVVSKVVAQWWAAASPADRRMLAGIKIGCEAGIGWQTWQYKDGNAIFLKHPHNTSFDPTTGANHSAPPPTDVRPHRANWLRGGHLGRAQALRPAHERGRAAAGALVCYPDHQVMLPMYIWPASES